MNTICIVEDDEVLREELCTLVRNAGYAAEVLTDLAHPEQLFQVQADLILLDINLPGTNGELLLRELRRKTDIPVIMVTSRTSEVDEVLSMSYGADDYITKPYNPTILLLRISAVLKRTRRAEQRTAYRHLQVDPAKGSLTDGEQAWILTKNEMIIFQLLLDRQGEIVTRDALMTALWDNEEFVNDNALSVNVSRLRTKLAEAGCADAIETRKKQGYILL